jgi:hypothetical protein
MSVRICVCQTLLIVKCASMVLLNCQNASAAENPLQVQWRVVPDSSKYAFSCVASNVSENAVELQGVTRFFEDSNSVGIGALDDPSRVMHGLGAISSPVDDLYHMSVLNAGESHIYYVLKEEFVAQGDDLIVGHYIEAYWFYGRVYSNPLAFGFSKPDGSIITPVVDSGARRPVVESGKLVIRPAGNPPTQVVLAFIFNENQTNELGFLFLNGSNETVTVEKPLTQASRIVATSPAIEYTKELFIAGQPSENIAIESGKVGEWRIPWQTIRDLIPAADLAAIKEAGGDLDLVWKVGDFQSDPLPLSLSDPPGDSN